jgi:hypothetical protein
MYCGDEGNNMRLGIDWDLIDTAETASRAVRGVCGMPAEGLVPPTNHSNAFFLATV